MRWFLVSYCDAPRALFVDEFSAELWRDQHYPIQGDITRVYLAIPECATDDAPCATHDAPCATDDAPCATDPVTWDEDTSSGSR